MLSVHDLVPKLYAAFAGDGPVDILQMPNEILSVYDHGAQMAASPVCVAVHLLSEGSVHGLLVFDHFLFGFSVEVTVRTEYQVLILVLQSNVLGEEAFLFVSFATEVATEAAHRFGL